MLAAAPPGGLFCDGESVREREREELGEGLLTAGGAGSGFAHFDEECVIVGGLGGGLGGVRFVVEGGEKGGCFYIFMVIDDLGELLVLGSRGSDGPELRAIQTPTIALQGQCGVS